eukprot:8463628-Pyramimonas_sp.AAC.1
MVGVCLTLRTRDIERSLRRELPQEPRRQRPRAATPMSARSTRGSRPFPPLLFFPLCPRTPKSKAAGAAQRGAFATRAGRPEGVTVTRA